VNIRKETAHPPETESLHHNPDPLKKIIPHPVVENKVREGLETKTLIKGTLPNMKTVSTKNTTVNPDVDRLTSENPGSFAPAIEIIAIDFETYFDQDYTLKTMGSQKYSEDPRFECYMVSMIFPDGSGFVGSPENAPWYFIHGRWLAAHNAGFDRVVFERLKKDGIIPEFVEPAGWIDTAALATYQGAPRDLKGATEALFENTIDKEYRTTAKGRHWDDYTPEEQAELKEACLADAKACREIVTQFYDAWPEGERLLSQLHMKHSDRGLRIDQHRLETGLAHLKELKAELESSIPWVPEGKAPSSTKQQKAYAADNGLPVPASFSKKNQEYLKWEKEYGSAHPVMGAVKDWREVNGLLKRLESIKGRIRKDGRISADLLYFGAGTTGRASGGTLNLQALPNGERFGVDIRSMLIPEEGYGFLQVDLAQIEPRVDATVMKDEPILNQVNEGVSLYEAYARSYLGWKGGKLKVEDPRLYALAKICMLSLSYGTGHVRYREACQEMGIDMTEVEARKAVEEYRGSQRKIVAQWRSLERRFKAHAGKAEPFTIDLPSGRKLRYHNCAYRPSDYSWVAQPVMGKPHRKFWGSKLFENAIQATARDVFMQQMLELEQQGLRTLFHVHDEVILEVPKEEIAEATELVERVMTTPPDWLPDLPLECEIKITNCFE
jgi:hypothetical protein